MTFVSRTKDETVGVAERHETYPNALPALSSPGMPFGELLGELGTETADPVYEGHQFEPFASPFQHADYVTNLSSVGRHGAQNDSFVEPFGMSFKQPPYSHHQDDDPEIYRNAYYDEVTQTYVFPDGIVAQKGWCRRLCGVIPRSDMTRD